MKTFSNARDFIQHPHFMRDRSNVLSGLRLESIDAPIRDIVAALGKLPQCFTIQSCYGHFVWDGQPDAHNLAVLPLQNTGQIRYRIAYLALCIEKGERGEYLRDRFATLCEIDNKYVQFGSPGWFWQQYPNSYALQVEPNRFASQDEALLEHAEALHVQSVRDVLFKRVGEVLAESENQIWAV
jgi:hypothetical protein